MLYIFVEDKDNVVQVTSYVKGKCRRRIGNIEEETWLKT